MLSVVDYFLSTYLFDKGNREDHQAIHHWIVLKVNAVEDKQSGTCVVEEAPHHVESSAPATDGGFSLEISDAAIEEDEVWCDHWGSLVEQDWVLIVLKVLNMDHLSVDEGGRSGQEPLEIGKEGGIVQCPDWCRLEVPVL